MGCLAFVAGLSLVLSARAEAVQYEFAVQREDGEWKCNRVGKSDEGEGVKVVVGIVGAAAIQEASFALHPADGGEKLGDLTQPSSQDRIWETLVGEVVAKGAALEVRGTVRGQDDATAMDVSCPSFKLSPGGPAQPGGDTAGGPDLSEWDPKAWRYLRDQGLSTDLDQLEDDLRRLRRKLRREGGKQPLLLLHLPSGKPAAPFPESVPESDELQVVVVLPEEEAVPYEVVVKSCPDTNPFRIEGKIEDLGELEGFVPSPKFALYPLGKPFQCGAGNLVYQVKPLDAASGADTNLRVRPVYHLATTVAYGFDFSE